MLLTLSILFLSIIVIFCLFFLWARSPGSRGANLHITQDSTPQDPIKQKSFKALTYNIGYASGEANNLRLISKDETLSNLTRIREFMKQSDVDFALLQEVDYRCCRTGFLDQADFLKQGRFRSSTEAVGWNKNYVPFPIWPIRQHFGRMRAGQTTLSRFFVERAERFVLEKPRENSFLWNSFYLDRLALVTCIPIGDQLLHLVNIHLEAFVVPSRKRQAKALKTLLEPFSRFPLIVGGDFNTVGAESTLTALTENDFLRQTQTRFTPTFPSWEPTLHLDHFLVNSRIEMIRCEVTPVPGNPSDHHPVLLEFRIH